MKVLVVEDDKSLAARLAMMMASAGINASMFDELPVKKSTTAKPHERHQGSKEQQRRLKRLNKEAK